MTQTTALPSSPTPVAPAVVVERTLSVVAFALGVASVVLGQTFVVPIAAMVLGIVAYRREPSARAFAVWGIVLGAVMAFGWLVVGVIGVVFAAPFFLFGLL